MSQNTSFVPVPFSCVYSSEAPRSANLVWLNMYNLYRVEFVGPHITTLLKNREMTNLVRVSASTGSL